MATEMMQKLQQRRNVNEFMKKIESSRKLQSELVTTKKIDKYKEIIMKLNGPKLWVIFCSYPFIFILCNYLIKYWFDTFRI